MALKRFFPPSNYSSDPPSPSSSSTSLTWGKRSNKEPSKNYMFQKEIKSRSFKNLLMLLLISNSPKSQLLILASSEKSTSRRRTFVKLENSSLKFRFRMVHQHQKHLKSKKSLKKRNRSQRKRWVSLCKKLQEKSWLHHMFEV